MHQAHLFFASIWKCKILSLVLGAEKYIIELLYKLAKLVNIFQSWTDLTKSFLLTLQVIEEFHKRRMTSYCVFPSFLWKGRFKCFFLTSPIVFSH